MIWKEIAESARYRAQERPASPAPTIKTSGVLDILLRRSSSNRWQLFGRTSNAGNILRQSHGAAQVPRRDPAQRALDILRWQAILGVQLFNGTWGETQ